MSSGIIALFFPYFKSYAGFPTKPAKAYPFTKV